MVEILRTEYNKFKIQSTPFFQILIDITRSSWTIKITQVIQKSKLKILEDINFF